jgi:putative PIG3 family NAD(P)H quinone oxidoreductase
MIAIEITQPGAPDVLVPVERPMPRPGPGEVLIKVEGAGLNYGDTLQRRGLYPPPPGASDIPGLEVAGTVQEIGTDVDQWRAGDRICALLTGGGYAQYCVAPAAQCLPIPRPLDMVAAAAVPETFFTVWTNVVDRGRLKAGEWILIHGGASGIGTTAIQLARAFGALVLTTAGSPEKCAACERLGAERAINYRQTDFVEATREATGGQGVHLILDIVGGDYIQRNLDALALEGRLVQIGVIGGSMAQVNTWTILMRRLTFTGSTLRARSVAEKGAIAAALHERVWPLLDSGAIAPVIHRTFPMERAADAHRAMEENRHIGKLVLVPNH